jgi:hypothetical protein
LMPSGSLCLKKKLIADVSRGWASIKNRRKKNKVSHRLIFLSFAPCFIHL